MRPVVTCAVTSLPWPTVFDRCLRAGGYGRSGGVTHCTCCHWVFGYVDEKHPPCDRGAWPCKGDVCRICLCQASNSCADGVCANAEAAHVRVMIVSGNRNAPR